MSTETYDPCSSSDVRPLKLDSRARDGWLFLLDERRISNFSFTPSSNLVTISRREHPSELTEVARSDIAGRPRAMVIIVETERLEVEGHGALDRGSSLSEAAP